MQDVTTHIGSTEQVMIEYADESISEIEIDEESAQED